jgi:UDPglucose 6-dehydrogenase
VNIVIIGSGYVGTTAAALFSVSGHNVTAIDLDPKKVTQINNGKAPFYEDGLNRIIEAGIEKGTLVATSDYNTAVASADIVFSCVGTPDNPDGSSNLSYIFGAAKEAAEYLKDGAIFVQKSTVPVGTGRKVIELLPKKVSYVSNPEFLRESTAIYDTLMFDRVVAGGDDDIANEAVLQLHRTVEDHFEDISRISGINYTPGHTGSYISTRLESAELIKVTANAFLALKISFANSIAQLSDAAGADVQEVMSIVGEDQRIGKAFFNAGRGYGGGCFPKDVSGLISSAGGFGVDMPIMDAVSSVNASMPPYVINRLLDKVQDLTGTTVAVLGLAFKANTSDARRSPAIKLANLLAEKGAKVVAYDPQANEEAKPALNNAVRVVNSQEEALAEASIAVIATDWSEFKAISVWAPNTPHLSLLVDAANCLDLNEVKRLDIDYIGIGRKV